MLDDTTSTLSTYSLALDDSSPDGMPDLRKEVVQDLLRSTGKEKMWLLWALGSTIWFSPYFRSLRQHSFLLLKPQLEYVKLCVLSMQNLMFIWMKTGNLCLMTQFPRFPPTPSPLTMPAQERDAIAGHVVV